MLLAGARPSSYFLATAVLGGDLGVGCERHARLAQHWDPLVQRAATSKTALRPYLQA